MFMFLSSLIYILMAIATMLFAAVVADRYIKARHQAVGHQRQLWFEYSALAARTARELREDR